MNLQNLKIKTGMNLLIGMAIVAISGLGIFAEYTLHTQSRVKDIPFMSSEADSSSESQINAFYSMMIHERGSEEYNEHRNEFDEHDKEIQEIFDELINRVEETGFGASAQTGRNEILDQFRAMKAEHQVLGAKFREIIDNVEGGENASITAAINSLGKAHENYVAQFHKWELKIDAAIEEATSTSQWEMRVGIIVVAALLLVLSLVLARKITAPLDRLMEAARRMGEGDMTMRLDMRSDNEIGALARVLDETALGLGRMAMSTRETVSSLQTTSAEMTSSVASQSAGASEQAAAVTEVTTTLEQIRENSNTTLEQAQSLMAAAERIRVQGERGSVAVEDTVRAMVQIQDEMKGIAETILKLSNQTKQIGEITGAVQSLSQQSKMLALNASIEAAKAGDAGKGFAVVAGEVRKLAEQSEEATNQVKSILDEIQKATENAVMATEEGGKKVAEGGRMVEQAGLVVAELRGIIDETTRVSQQITAAVREEATGIQQASGAMAEISKVINHFVAATQQNQTAAGEVGRLATVIQEGVSVYKIDFKAAE